MKDDNKGRARVPDVPALEAAPGFSEPNRSVVEREQLLRREQEARLEAEVMRDANLALTEDNPLRLTQRLAK